MNVCGGYALLAGLLGIGTASAQEATAERVLAWYRFEAGAQSYKETPYLWLGDHELRLSVDVKPRAGQVLELSWGAKGDTREAELAISDKVRTLRHGGHDGFAWVRVALPKITADRYELVLRRTRGKPAFFAEVRLRGDGDVAPESALGKDRYRMRLETGPARMPDAFPAMRAIWDRAPAPSATPLPDAGLEAAFVEAERNARRANEMFFRCRRFVQGWLAQADTETGLIPRNLDRSRDIWNAQDAAADNYPFMVLTAAITDRPLFEGRMLEMLRTETRLTSRVDRLPDTWSFRKQAFASAEPELGGIIFGGSEYVKDGLLPLTEWLGPSPWSERMLGIVDDIWKHAPVETPRGRIPSTNVEVNGEMLQALSRIYWMTGERRYLDCAVRLGDYYLLGDKHPARDADSLRLRDHGCEIVSGLTELYAAVHHAMPEKRKAYEGPIHELCDCILEIGRNPHGMLYDTIHPKTGSHSAGICDTWGYNYNAIYTVYLLDGVARYREAVVHVLRNLGEYRDHDWGSADEFADSIEGAINLYNREPVPAAAAWIDSEIHDMWRGQRPDGVIEGWHGDGNSARTAIMYALWKTQGVTVQPFRNDVRFGAVRVGKRLCVSIRAEEAWTGKLVFDRPRHRETLHLPLDYPRINQFPEWFVAETGKQYVVRDVTAAAANVVGGEQLLAGWSVSLEAGEEMRVTVDPVESGR